MMDFLSGKVSFIYENYETQRQMPPKNFVRRRSYVFLNPALLR